MPIKEKKLEETPGSPRSIPCHHDHTRDVYSKAFPEQPPPKPLNAQNAFKTEGYKTSMPWFKH